MNTWDLGDREDGTLVGGQETLRRFTRTESYGFESRLQA